MGFQIPPILAIVGLACAGEGLLFQIIGVATTGWLTISSFKLDTNVGLWKYCVLHTCGDLPSVPETGE